MGKKEVYLEPDTVTLTFEIPRLKVVDDPTAPGTATLTFPVNRVKEVEDPTTPPSSGQFFLKFGTKGSMKLAEELLFVQIEKKKPPSREVFREMLDVYYSFRVAHEAGVPTIPVVVEDEEES